MYNRPTTIFCKSALFACTCCSYTTTIYSDTEWLEVSDNPPCKSCAGNCQGKSRQAFIFRDDIQEDFPLHMHGCLMPDGKAYCLDADYPSSFVHWTMLLVSCPVCDDDTMLFTKYRQGENILEFYEQCVDATKLAYPLMMWLDDNGHRSIHFSWPGCDFSST